MTIEPEKIGVGNFRDYEDQMYQSPIVTRQNAFVTTIPEEQKGHIIRGVRCTCGREIMRRMGVDDFACNSCGRQYSWRSELTGKELFTRI